MMIANLHYVHMAAKFNPSLWQAFKNNMPHVGLTTFKADSIFKHYFNISDLFTFQTMHNYLVLHLSRNTTN